MQENEPIEKKRNNTSAPRGGPPKKHVTFTFEERLRAVKLHLEEGFTQELVAQEMGVSLAAIGKWLHSYRLHGEEGLSGAWFSWCFRVFLSRGMLERASTPRNSFIVRPILVT